MNFNPQELSQKHSDYERPNLNTEIVALPTFNQETDRDDNSVTNDLSPIELTLPSLRSRRGSFTFAMTGLTIGFLLIAFNSPWSKEFLAPGPLSSPHAQLLAGRRGARCGACHGAAHESFSRWASGHQDDTAQIALCMKCHEKTIGNSFALYPHGISTEQLAHCSGNADTVPLSPAPQDSITGQLVRFSGLSHGNEITCSVCHQEHHGNVSLSTLTDQQCQSCHAQTFHSFETDHPEFNQWPQIARQRIAFDHGTHLNKHFKNAQTNFECNLCHVGDGQQKVQRLTSFEQACGNCHAQQIADSGQTGWKLLALPILDMAAIESQKLNVGNWPVVATGDFDGELPPMMRLLLAGDRKTLETISKLKSDFSFGDIDTDDPESVELAVELVWGIKRLLHELAQEGQTAIDRRMSAVMKDRFSSAVSNQLLSGLTPEVFSATAKRWLPNLAEELQTQSAQQLSNTSPVHSALLTAYTRPAKPVQELPNQELPNQELLAENPLSANTLQDLQKSRQNEDSSNQKEDIEEGETETGMSYLSELLATNPLHLPAETMGRPLDTHLKTSPEAKAGITQTTTAPLTAPPSEIRLMPEVAGVVLKSGWYRDDRLLEIGYRPIIHADKVVMSWNDCISRVESADTNDAVSALFQKANSTAAPGGCRRCHTVNRTDGDIFEFAWVADRPKSERASFTKFSHRPHLTLDSINACSSCHKMNEDASLIGTFESCVGRIGMSNFHPIVKADCVSCHQKGRTESGCMQCHNYHIGKPD